MPKNRKRWIYWVICTLVLAGAAAIILASLPKEEVISADRFDGIVKLSELPESDCLEFIKSRKISVPDELISDDIGKFVKDSIVRFEADPYAPAVYDSGVTVKFAEDIRTAVNQYYKVPTLQNGTYAFDKCLYMTPISSYYPFEGTGEEYIVGDDAFQIVNLRYPKESKKIQVSIRTVQPVNINTWDARFKFLITGDAVDISGYTHRACYPVSDRYQILLMDDEIWLAAVTSDSGIFWSIYKLKPAA